MENLKSNLPEGYDESKLISDLCVCFKIKKEQTITDKLTIYDTFDWSIFNKSFVLYCSDSKLLLRKLYKDKIIYSSDITFAPVFIWDFPEGRLKEFLSNIIKNRALFKIAHVYSISTSYRVLNKSRKTVARIIVEKNKALNAKDAPILSYNLWVKPVRGYPKYYQNLLKHFTKSGFAACKKQDIYFKALNAAGKDPKSYSGKLKLKLKPMMSTDGSIRIILRSLLKIIKINKTNIKKDFDTEILHDLRVAVRKTRSVLSQVKNVFDLEMTEQFKKDFKFIGKFSNELRDLDVYLLNENIYRAMLPDALSEDIDPLFDHLKAKRSKALKKVVINLDSKRYEKIIHNWEQFLNEPSVIADTTFNAELQIIDVSRKRIYKIYKNILKKGKLCLKDKQDEKLHALRIQCKKLRYLMEFFSSLFPAKKINALIKQLKSFQDNLGLFNDLCVQQEYLLDISEELLKTDIKSSKTLNAIGSLIGMFDREKQVVKDAFDRSFNDYASSANKKLFQELFLKK